jgi:hypothetical protein
MIGIPEGFDIIQLAADVFAAALPFVEIIGFFLAYKVIKKAIQMGGR